MKTRYVLLLAGMAAAIAALSPSLLGSRAEAQSSGGMLDTLPHGTYQCALPGDATAKPFEVVPSEEFQIKAASKYQTAQGSGTYIMRGSELTFTSGPKKGQRYRRVGTNQVRKLSGKEQTRILCQRLGSTG